MIYSLLLIPLILSVSVHSFYITNAAVLEQCSAQPITYLDKFDPTKMLCVNQGWRQTFIFLEYSCINNVFTRIWTIKTNSGKNFPWPPVISLIANTQYTRFDKTNSNSDLTIEENSNSFDANNNQLTTYLWTSLGIGPQCRIKYSIMKDICIGKMGAVGAKFTDFVCYYGKQTFNFQNADQRKLYDNLIDNNRKAGSHIPLSSNNKTNSPIDPNHSPMDPNLQAIAAGKSSFWTKYKRYIVIGGIILLVIIIILIIVIIIRSSRSSSEKMSEKTSDESTLE